MMMMMIIIISPLVQEKYQAEKVCDKRYPYRIIIIIIIEHNMIY